MGGATQRDSCAEEGRRRGAGNDEPSPNMKSVPTIRVKVKHAGVTHEIYISSPARLVCPVHSSDGEEW